MKNLTTQEKVALLEKDFLERDGQSYVRIRTTDRLGWEDALPEDSAYSSVILNPKSEKELYHNALSIAKNMIASMNHPYKVTVKVNNDKNCTDSKTVWVATKVFDDKRLELGKKLDVFIGEAVHEGSHLLYTDFSYNPANNNNVIHGIWNIIEDEMIERHIGEDCPGLANFLKATKYYYFDRAMQEAPKKLNDLARCFNAILALVRYPASLNPEDAEEFVDILLETKRILTPYPQDTVSSAKAALEIYELLKQFADQMPQNGQGDSQQQGDGQGDDQSDGQGSGQGGAQGGNQKDKDDRENGGDNGQDDNSQSQSNGETDQNQSQDGQDSQHNKGGNTPKKTSDKDIEEALKDILDALKKNIRNNDNRDNNNPTISEQDMSDALKKDNHLLARDCDGELEIGKCLVIQAKEPNRATFRYVSREVLKWVPAVAQALRCHGEERNTKQTCLRRGNLDGNRLAEALQGAKNVYYREETVRPDRINLAILIDESGSMKGEKERLARQAAILINEAVGDIPNVELNIYGYTNDLNQGYLFPYREWGRPFNKETLGAISACGGTPTAEAIIETVDRIRKKSKNKSVLLVISDGEANGGTQPVREAVDQVKALGVEVIGISIDSDLTVAELKAMYNQWIDMSNIQNLVKGLSTVVKKIVLKTQRRNYAA